jgi:hypothetical protein
MREKQEWADQAQTKDSKFFFIYGQRICEWTEGENDRGWKEGSRPKLRMMATRLLSKKIFSR